MNFDSYQYLYPPRPDKAIPSHLLPFYEARSYVGQIKKNGTCNVLAVGPDKQIRAMSRHADAHKLWEPTDASSAIFQSLPGKGWYVFVCELLHSKISGGRKDTNYINDILVSDGTYLVGTSFSQRMDMLTKMFQGRVISEDHAEYKLDENTSLAKCFTNDFLKRFEALADIEDEGLVLKSPKATLAICSKAKSNIDWMVKCRKAHKNYAF